MANSQRSYLSSFVDLFTLMLNTPLVDPEPTTQAAAFPLKTFVSNQRPSVEYSEQPGSPRSTTSVCSFDAYVYRKLLTLSLVSEQE